jgi:hypothetical protein
VRVVSWGVRCCGVITHVRRLHCAGHPPTHNHHTHTHVCTAPPSPAPRTPLEGKDWSGFVGRLQQHHLPLLAKLGYLYRPLGP